MPGAAAPTSLSFRTLFGLACLTAFLASVAGPALFIVGAALVGPASQGDMGWSTVLLPFALIGFLFTFPIGLAVLLLVGPLATWRLGTLIRDRRGPSTLVGMVVGALLGLATATLLFGAAGGAMAASGAVSGACYGLLWIWFSAWQLRDAQHGSERLQDAQHGDEPLGDGVAHG
ncbi:MAG: hypothetical protein BGP16_06305 [Sphingobium sp. 66-54]|nr:MAG: hypothetical protein BGP16_06305 [Sphingobium sp. 66-54]